MSRDEKMMEQSKASIEDLSKAIGALSRDFAKNKDKWENWTVEAYLESVSAWLVDHQSMKGKNTLTLDEVFEVLLAGKYYE